MKAADKILHLLFITIPVIGIFIFSIFVFSKLALAWESERSAESVCVLNTNNNVNYVNIRVSFTNKEDRAVNVTAHDDWTTQQLDLGKIEENQTKTGLIKTGQTSIGDNTVTFFIKWWHDKEERSKTKKAEYKALKCPQAIPTEKPTPTDTPKPTTTPTLVPPTSTPVPPTSMPTSPAPVVNNNVSANATAKANVEVNVQQQQTAQQQTVQPTPVPQVLAATTKIKELPKTGGENAVLAGLFSMIPLGIYLRNKAKNLPRKI